MKKITLLLLAVLLNAAALWARPALKRPVDIVQPDGSTVTIQLHGDEYLSFTATIDGYTVMKCADGYYRYAQKNADGGLMATNVIAHNPESRTAAEKAFLAPMKKMVAPKMSAASKQRKEMAAQMISPAYSADRQGRRTPPSIWPLINYDNFKGLVVLVEWNDKQFTLANPQEFYQKLTSEKNYTDASHTHYPVDVEGSVRDYFYDNSMGKFDPTFDVVGPVTIDYSCNYPCPKKADGTDDDGFYNRFINIIKAVMTKVNETVNFGDYDLNSDGKIDMVYFIFAGYGSYVQGNSYKYIWPHANDFSGIASWYGLKYDNKRFGRYACGVEIQDYEGYANMPGHPWLDGIGTMCHEFSHVLGLADHYDTDYEENGQSNDPGGWDVMAGGADYNYGLTPVGYNSFERYMLTFSDPQVLTEAGSYELQPFNTSNQSFILNTGSAGDDFYLENRQNTRWDRYLPGHGLVVWRADTSNKNVWTGNTVNNYADHNYFVMTANAPGKNNIKDLTATGTPALTSWAGKPANLDLFDITETGDIVTFQAGADLYESVIEDFESTPLTEGSGTGLTGVYCTWDLSNASVVEDTDGHHVVKLYRAGNGAGMLTSSVFENGVRTLNFTVKTEDYPARFKLRVSTDGGAFTDLISNTTIAKNNSKDFEVRDIPANSQIRFEASFTSTSGYCFVDNIVATFPDNVIPTAIERITTQPVWQQQNAIYNLQGQRVGADYKGIVIVNGKKIIR